MFLCLDLHNLLLREVAQKLACFTLVKMMKVMEDPWNKKQGDSTGLILPKYQSPRNIYTTGKVYLTDHEYFLSMDHDYISQAHSSVNQQDIKRRHLPKNWMLAKVLAILQYTQTIKLISTLLKKNIWMNRAKKEYEFKKKNNINMDPSAWDWRAAWKFYFAYSRP